MHGEDTEMRKRICKNCRHYGEIVYRGDLLCRLDRHRYKAFTPACELFGWRKGLEPKEEGKP